MERQNVPTPLPSPLYLPPKHFKRDREKKEAKGDTNQQVCSSLSRYYISRKGAPQNVSEAVLQQSIRKAAFRLGKSHFTPPTRRPACLPASRRAAQKREGRGWRRKGSKLRNEFVLSKQGKGGDGGGRGCDTKETEGGLSHVQGSKEQLNTSLEL